MTLLDPAYSVMLWEARDRLRARLRNDGGVQCPVCDQHAQIYRWSLYATAAWMLVRMYQRGGTEEFIESKTVKFAGQGGDATRLRFWGLVEQESERRGDGGRSGWWRVTDLGEDFVLRRATIPKYVDVYNGEVLDTYGPPVDIVSCLGKRFDWGQMMSGRF